MCCVCCCFSLFICNFCVCMSLSLFHSPFFLSFSLLQTNQAADCLTECVSEWVSVDRRINNNNHHHLLHREKEEWNIRNKNKNYNNNLVCVHLIGSNNVLFERHCVLPADVCVCVLLAAGTGLFPHKHHTVPCHCLCFSDGCCYCYYGVYFILNVCICVNLKSSVV